jgi:hypothetical protein
MAFTAIGPDRQSILTCCFKDGFHLSLSRFFDFTIRSALQSVLRFRVALFGSFTVPFGGFIIVLKGTTAFL